MKEDLKFSLDWLTKLCLTIDGANLHNIFIEDNGDPSVSRDAEGENLPETHIS